MRLLVSWRHSGLSVHSSAIVPPYDLDGIERLTCYLLHPPVGLERLKVDEHSQAIAHAARIRPTHEPRAAATPLDANAFLARRLMCIVALIAEVKTIQKILKPQAAKTADRRSPPTGVTAHARQPAAR
jgi:hypothetical protein